jgi:RNAse (barnase) inhibitor barstar
MNGCVAMQNSKRVYEIDGSDFKTLDEFYDTISRVLIPNVYWGRNLDAFNDILRGGFGTPERGFILRWKNSQISRNRLGYQETVRQLELNLARCHPSSRQSVRNELALAKERVGSTVFDRLIEIINVHCAGGKESEDGVELLLD